MALIKKKKKLFAKLYRYYCRQIWQKVGMLILYTLIGLVYLLINLSVIRKLLPEANNWQTKLTVFWWLSIFQLFIVAIPASVLASALTGRGLGWEEAKKRQFFRQPKLSREHDTRVIIFCPRTTRKTMVSAKFAATFTYFMVLNFLFCLPMLIYFIATTELGIMALGAFLFLNGIIFGLINFT
ncbi:MAG: hypothetical protein I3275_06380, partial [Candidatus Moeniiplasma glomeromycotorum]|nr:hypothetical protein [Candidatus Moeniiplasma glomeromycotorum]